MKRDLKFLLTAVPSLIAGFAFFGLRPFARTHHWGSILYPTLIGTVLVLICCGLWLFNQARERKARKNRKPPLVLE